MTDINTEDHKIFLDHIAEFRKDGDIHVFRPKVDEIDASVWNAVCAEANRRFNTTFNWFVRYNDELLIGFKEVTNV